MHARKRTSSSFWIGAFALITLGGAYASHLWHPQPPPKKYFGVYTHALNARGAFELSYIHANIVRTDVFAWDVLEPQKGHYDFSSSDTAVAWARKNTFDLLGVLLYTPPWESGASFHPVREAMNDCGIPPKNSFVGSSDQFRVIPPKNFDDFAQFVYTTVKRYPTVRYWQIWNEPNNPLFWQPKPDAAAYAGMLQKAYAAVKRANPKAQVVLGGISLVDLKYLGELYAAGAAPYFDIMAVHPYNPAQSPSAYLEHEMRNLHSFMERSGDSSKDIWITEIGWHTGTAGHAIDEKVQADYLRRLYDITGSLGFIGPVFWHTLQDCTDDYQADQPEHNFGLFRHDHKPKPAAEIYRVLTQQAHP